MSHETIYQAMYLQTRGNLRAELRGRWRCVRAGPRAGRRLARPARGDPTPVAGSDISDRPAEAADRAVPGHWEGDLVIGADGKSAIVTLVERTTRFVMLVATARRPRRREQVIAALSRRDRRLPEHLRRSLTWDQGTEMARHAEFTVATGCPVYFCDPHSPWQRGTNENTNGLLRQYFPKGRTDFPPSPRPTSTTSPTNSTAAPAKPSAGTPPPRKSTNSRA